MGCLKLANEKRLDLIDRQQLLYDLGYDPKMANWVKPNSTFDCVLKAPTVDAVEVVHGYWTDSYNVDHMGRVVEHGIDCSVCESVFKDDSRDVVKRWKERFNVCPFCGAVMDGGNEDV